jgi:hypothetical protein
MGKTTLAERYAEKHPMTLNLDIDNIWVMMSGWDKPGSDSNHLKFKYAYTIADMHLAEGYDVIVPQLMESNERYRAFERIARANNAALKEVVLLSNCDDAIERCKARARAQGHPEGFRPGGVLDTGGREKMLKSMFDNVVATVGQRPNMQYIEPVEHDIHGTYQKLLTAIS